ncbi:MAG: hypothetical protein KF681_08490 [Bdellovibrionaceae bacterium]|nr:hypothetical protein [Pseudobdellovibrionaceae bacterium]
MNTVDICDWLPEFQVSAETDTDLQEYFFKVPEVQKITQSRAWLVLGRKGTGKTAIYEHLRSADSGNLNNYNVISLNFKDYPWPAHRIYKESLAGELSAYQKSWRYLFFVKVISRLIEIKKTKGEELSKELRWAESYINRIYGNPNPTLMEVLISKLARVQKVETPGMELGEISAGLGSISLDEVAADKELQSRLRTNAFNLLSYFEDIFIRNADQYKFLIALDQLDENWLAGEIDEYSKVLINLVNVCRNISIDSKISKSIKVVPFLRSDIYNQLRFNDKNKLLQDSAIEIKWETSSLDKMFFERIKKHKPAGVSLDTDKKTGCIFEAAFVRQGTPAFTYITRRSFYRPRDIIVYINKIRSCHEPNKTGLFSTNEIYQADREASASIYNEIIDEWTNQFPEIEKLLNVLQTIQVESFDLNLFKEKYSSEFSNASEGDMRSHLQFLFDNSIVGQKRQGRWEYICSTPNLKMNIEKEYRTHPALKYRLQLIESRTTQAESSTD